MAWDVRIERRAQKELRKLARPAQVRVLAFLHNRLATMENPRDIGESLAGNLGGFWKYRIGDYRLIASIEDEVIRVNIIRIGHRRDVYR